MHQAEAREEDTPTLTKKLRDFSVKYVKISEDDMTLARKLVKEYIENKIIMYCQENSKIQILKLEYTGSFYEKLKTEAADEVDIMVVFKTQRAEIKVKESVCPGLSFSWQEKAQCYVIMRGIMDVLSPNVSEIVGSVSFSEL